MRERTGTARRAGTRRAPVATKRIARTVSRYFEVRRSGIQGRGAFATQRIRKGTRIIEYAGERISNEEADRRYDETRMRRHHTFLFTLDADTVVDGAIDGNESIYINHSCDPNCEAVITGGRIWIHALRTIYPGEELVYDYQYERTGGPDDAELESFYACQCGAPNCRGSIMKPAPRSRPRGSGTAARRKRDGNTRGHRGVAR